jgi:DDE family transposase
VLPELLHGSETRVWGDQAYRGRRPVICRHAPKARDFINRRYRHRGVVDEIERAKKSTKSKVRAKSLPSRKRRVEHPIGIIKRMLGFSKVRYRGLKRNAHRLIVTCALASLFTARRHLLRCQGRNASTPGSAHQADKQGEHVLGVVLRFDAGRAERGLELRRHPEFQEQALSGIDDSHSRAVTLGL